MHLITTPGRGVHACMRKEQAITRFHQHRICSLKLKAVSLAIRDNKMSADNVVIKTVFKMMDLPPDGMISREDYVKYAEHERDHFKLLNPDEAEKVYSGILALSDMLGLDKYAKDGGMSYTLRELNIVRRVLSRKDMPAAELSHTLNSAYFRAIDTNGDHFLERSEWINYLKICKTFTTEEQAMQSFDSLDKNKDGVISLEEYVEKVVDFWFNLGEEHDAQNLYGTKDL